MCTHCLNALSALFLDRRAAERLPCSWTLLSQFIVRVLLEILLLVIFVLEISSLGFIFVLDLSSLGCIVLCLIYPDGCHVQRVPLCILYLDGCRVEP